MKIYADYRAELQTLTQAALLSPGLLPPNEFNLARYSLSQHTRNRLLDPDICALEDYLIDNSALPGGSSNLELLRAFGDVVEGLCRREDIPLQVGYKNMEWLLAWLNMHNPPSFFGEDPDSPLQILQMAAGVGMGVWAAIFTQIQSGVATLLELSNNPLWRVRDTAAMGLSRMLALEWEMTLRRLRFYAMQANGREWRAMVESVAQPGLLRTQPYRVIETLDLQQSALRFIYRMDGDHTDLMDSLSGSIAITVAALPSVGFGQLSAWAAWPHERIKTVVRGSVARLNDWPDAGGQITKILDS